MAQRGSSYELLKEAANYVYTGSLWVPMLADASGQILAGIIADQAMQARSYGYVGGAWQKDPLRLGYSARQTDDVSFTRTGTGAYNLLGTTVPAGELWVVNMVCSSSTVDAVAQQIFAYTGALSVALQNAVTPTAGNWNVVFTNNFVLGPGDSFYTAFSSGTIGAVLRQRLWGMRVDIDL